MRLIFMVLSYVASLAPVEIALCPLLSNRSLPEGILSLSDKSGVIVDSCLSSTRASPA
jgi:hypothetical protein